MYVCMYVVVCNVDLPLINPPTQSSTPLNYKTRRPKTNIFHSFLMSVCLALWTSIAKRDKLQLLRPLQSCRELESESNCKYYDGSSIADRETETATTTAAPVLQRERKRENKKKCNYCDPSSMAERETASTARDSETADVEDLRSLAFLNEIPDSGSKKSIHLEEVLTAAAPPNYKPPQL